MFTWICPTCGREVPPSYDECPDCAARARAAAPAETAQTPAATPLAAPIAAPQPVAPPPSSQQYAPPLTHYLPPPPQSGLPTWVLSILFALAFVGLGAGVYWVAHNMRNGNASATSAPLDTPPVKATGKQNPLQKYVEVTGIRFIQNAKKDTEARFVVVNHSGADIQGLAGSVNIWGRTARSEEEAAGNFAFDVPSLGPYESKEESAVVQTKLKAYELPDWQNVSTEVQITAP